MEFIQDYEALPQREPKPKRRRRLESEDTLKSATVSQQVDTSKVLGATEDRGGITTAENVAEHIHLTDKVISRDDDNLNIRQDIEKPEAYRAAAVPGQKFEWGSNLREAFENVGLCMVNYMTPLEGISQTQTRTYSAKGHDLSSLLYHWLDELLFGFATEFFVPKTLEITVFDRDTGWRIEGEGSGEIFDRERHVSGTEIKAITYSAMQINETDGDAEVFVIVDI